MTLKNCSLGDVGAAIVSEILTRPSCTITRLDLTGNQIGEKGLFALATAMVTNVTVVEMVLDGNEFVRVDVLKAVQEKCQSNARAAGTEGGAQHEEQQAAQHKGLDGQRLERLARRWGIDSPPALAEVRGVVVTSGKTRRRTEGLAHAGVALDFGHGVDENHCRKGSIRERLEREVRSWFDEDDDDEEEEKEGDDNIEAQKAAGRPFFAYPTTPLKHAPLPPRPSPAPPRTPARPSLVSLPLSSSACMYSPAITRTDYHTLSAESKAIAEKVVKRQQKLEEMEASLYAEANRLAEREERLRLREAAVQETELVLAARWEALDEAYLELHERAK